MPSPLYCNVSRSACRDSFPTRVAEGEIPYIRRVRLLYHNDSLPSCTSTYSFTFLHPLVTTPAPPWTRAFSDFSSTLFSRSMYRTMLFSRGSEGSSSFIMHLLECVKGRAAGQAAIFLLAFVITYVLLWPPPVSRVSFRFQHRPAPAPAVPKDELERALEGASMGNRTLIISALNRAYAKENGMLDLFLRGLREGEDTRFLIKHLLLAAVDQAAFDRCQLLRLHCYQLITKDVNFSGEAIYMTDDFLKMMWRRTHFLGEVLRRGYSFIFTDMDVMWLRNPFRKLSHDGEDMQISCDGFNGRPLDYSNPINTGFYSVASNNKTIKLFDLWYEARNGSAGKKEQDMLYQMMFKGVFAQLGLKVRFLDTLYFSGFCQDSRDFREVTTVHANCCRSVKAKRIDLKAVFKVWKRFNATSNATWPKHKACSNSWKHPIKV